MSSASEAICLLLMRIQRSREGDTQVRRLILMDLEALVATIQEKLGTGQILDRHGIQEGAFDIWEHCVAESNRWERGALQGDRRGVTSGGFSDAIRNIQETAHSSANPDSSDRGRAPSVVHVYHVWMRSLASKLIALTNPPMEQCRTLEEWAQYQVDAAKALTQTGKLWQSLLADHKLAEDCYRQAAALLEPVLEAPDLVQPAGPAFGPASSSARHQGQALMLDCAVSRLDNARLFARDGNASQLEDEATNHAMRVFGDMAPHQACAMTPDLLCLGDLLMGSACSSIKESNAEERAVPGWAPTVARKLADCAAVSRSVATNPRIVAHVRALASDLEARSTLLSCALLLEPGSSPEHAELALRHLQPLLAEDMRSDGSWNKLVPVARLVNLRAMAVAGRATDARDALLSLAKYPETPQRTLAVGMIILIELAASVVEESESAGDGVAVALQMLGSAIVPASEILGHRTPGDVDDEDDDEQMNLLPPPSKQRRVSLRGAGSRPSHQGAQLPPREVEIQTAEEICCALMGFHEQVMQQVPTGIGDTASNPAPQEPASAALQLLLTQLEGIALGVVGQVHPAALDGTTGGDEAERASSLHQLLWDAGTRRFLAKDYGPAEKIYSLLGDKKLAPFVLEPADAPDEQAETIDEARAWSAAALCCIGQNQLERALEAADRANTLVPGRSHIAFVRLKVQMMLPGHGEAAEKQMQDLAACADFCPGYLRIACSEAQRTGRPEIAISAMRALQAWVQAINDGQAAGGEEADEQPGASLGERGAGPLTESAVLQALLRLAAAKMNAFLPAKSPGSSRAADPGAAAAAALSSGAEDDRLLVAAVDEVASIFNKARERAKRAGLAVFSAGLAPSSEASSRQLQESTSAWFADKAWECARAAEALAGQQGLGRGLAWQAAAVIWYTGAAFMEHLLHFETAERTQKDPSSSTDFRQGKRWMLSCMLALGALAALEAYYSMDATACDNAVTPSLCPAAESKDATRMGALSMAARLAEDALSSLRALQRLEPADQHHGAGGDDASSYGRGQPAARDEAVSSEDSGLCPLVHLTLFKIQVARGADSTELIMRLHEAEHLRGTDSLVLSCYVQACLQYHVQHCGRRASTDVACAALQKLLQSLLHDLANTCDGQKELRGRLTESSEEEEGGGGRGQRGALVLATLRQLLELGSSNPDTEDDDRLGILHQAADLMQVDEIHSAAGTDVEWMIVAAVNHSHNLHLQDRLPDAEQHLSAALRLVRASGVLRLREAEILAGVRALHSLTLLRQQDKTENPKPAEHHL